MTEEEEIQKQLDEAKAIKDREDKQKEFDFSAKQKYDMEYRNDKWILVQKNSVDKLTYMGNSWRKLAEKPNAVVRPTQPARRR